MDRKSAPVVVSVFCYCLLQMAMLGITPMLNTLSSVFPDASLTAIQTLVTFPNLMIALSSLCAGRLAAHIDKRRLMLFSCCLFLAVALGGFLFHGSVTILYLWSLLMGLGVGIMIPVSSSLWNDLFDKATATRLLGWQSVAVAAGGVLLSTLGGALSSIRWYAAYLLYWLILPGFFLMARTVPKGIYARREDGGRVRPTLSVVLDYGVIAFVMLSFCNAMPTNLSMYLAELGIENTAATGLGAGIMQLGSAVAGLLYGVYVKRLGERLLPIAFTSFAFGTALLLMGELPLIYIGMFFVGWCLTTVMVTCTAGVNLHEKPEAVTLSIAIIMAMGNCGGFLASFYTNLSRWIFGSNAVYLRYELLMALSIVMILLTLLRWLRGAHADKQGALER